MTVTLMAPVAARREGAAARDSPDGGSDTAGGASREARGLKIGSIRRMRASYKVSFCVFFSLGSGGGV